MNTSTHGGPGRPIYHLIGFSRAYVEKSAARHEFEKALPANQTRKEYSESIKAAPEIPFHDKHYRGCWLDREELIKIILAEEDCYDLHEGFFDYYLVETRLIGEIDDWDNKPDSKLWFKYDGEKYSPIVEPECFRQIVSFT